MKLTSTNLRSLGALFDGGTVTGLTDGQLLERFGTRGDAAAELAFAALVERHGPMVLGVCRRVLGDEHAAEDAFQTTFVVLVEKAGALRDCNLLTNWLYGVALRVANKDRGKLLRRRAVQRRAAQTLTLSEGGVDQAELSQPT